MLELVNIFLKINSYLKSSQLLRKKGKLFCMMPLLLPSLHFLNFKLASLSCVFDTNWAHRECSSTL